MSTIKLKKFDVVDFLDSDEALVEYLNAALERNWRLTSGTSPRPSATWRGFRHDGSVAESSEPLGRGKRSIAPFPAMAILASRPCSRSWRPLNVRLAISQLPG